MYKYVVFDVDGTMIDTEEAVVYAYQKIIFEKFGRNLTDDELLKGYGVPTPQALSNYGFTDIEAAIKDYYKYLVEGFSHCSAFDGIAEVIKELKARNIPMGIVTSRCKYEIDADMCLQGLIHNFVSVVSSDDTAKHKPNPDPLLKAMDDMKAVPSETIYIGDTVFDSKCARSAGIKFALAVWGTNNAGSIYADYYLNKPSELLNIL
ncbi:HAD superfamily hydrolase (TIGR01549 family) [Ruminiclostridium sufflavum DSM 19573]|uniref:HAD superfamily hydrolase (TIGR01549 family) n=1 Tax=Ruminiclostridium sufflavum DSM 19573 TaxID=1121337 RepID=A0A318XRV0_9FIRM|nr:HAD family hydrolase [Ruminiclostridium sufflavum]PYG90327.1 HAD superfamily hydrolase (TIGR01549 family) [Ruminiclostridium sufflavum DSM 19573]